MRLNKDKWDNNSLENILKLKSGNALPNHKIVNGDFPVYGGNGIVGYHNEFMIENSTIVIGRVGEYCGSIYLTKNKCWITDNGLYPVEYFKEIDQYYLKESLTYANLNHYARKTGQPSISQTSISQVKIPLPPLSEQKQIAELFQSIEKALEEVEVMERKMKELEKSLCNGLLLKEPEFGSLLNAKNCTKTKFGNISDCVEKHDKQKKDVSRFIGLENIEPENFAISTWGDIANGTTFTKRFEKGDVLFGKRRAYLKKVAVADFEGICSGDILVFRAKSGKILPELLPFYVAAETFIQYAVSTSAGSLSPRTKWKDLKEFEISIPEIKTQEKILEILKQSQIAIKQLKDQRQTLRNLKGKLLEEILG